MRSVPMPFKHQERRKRALARLLESRRVYQGIREERRINTEISILERRVYGKQP